jgi:hypothetical protein
MDDFESFPSAVYFWVYHGKMTVGWFYFTPFSVIPLFDYLDGVK